MKKFGLSLLLTAIMVLVTGCGSNSPSVPKIEVTKKFRVNDVKLNLSQLVQTKITYHTREELESILKSKIIEILKKKKLLSNDSKMDALAINVNYQRRFVGDETPIASDSLAYPNYSYTIKILKENKLIGSIKKDNLTFEGGFTMNLQIVAGTLRDKKYELEFIESLANAIVNDIESLN